jgi:hypothetical protein
MLKYHEISTNILVWNMVRSVKYSAAIYGQIFIGWMTDRLIVPLTSIRDISKVIEWTSMLIIHTTRSVQVLWMKRVFSSVNFIIQVLRFNAQIFVQVGITILIINQPLKTTRNPIFYIPYSDNLPDTWKPVDALNYKPIYYACFECWGIFVNFWGPHRGMLRNYSLQP